jgi:very-short-patch-repair endonuclease
MDVALPHLKLAIEADGHHHNAPGSRAKDAKKDAFVKGLGWTVLRFTNEAILDARTAVGVLADIEFTISKLEGTQATP